MNKPKQSSTSSVVHVRSRRARPGPETTLLNAVLKTEFLIGRPLPAVFFHEPDMPTGLPDLVAVYMSNGDVSMNRNRLHLGEGHVRLLHYLHVVRKAPQEKMLADLRISPRKLARLLADLRDAELITVSANMVRPRGLSRVFGVKYIVAIEAKMSNWSRALTQAAANHWFASHSYILIPPTKALSKVTAKASTLGIGVLVFDGADVSVALKPKARKLPGSYGSWLLNEWALRSGKIEG
jgi:hypothetical protein